MRTKNLVLIFLIFMLHGLVSDNTSLYAGDYKSITDMCGKRVEIPVNPKRIACMHCVSPEKIMTLGKGDSISLMAEQSPWGRTSFIRDKKRSDQQGRYTGTDGEYEH